MGILNFGAYIIRLCLDRVRFLFKSIKPDKLTERWHSPEKIIHLRPNYCGKL